MSYILTDKGKRISFAAPADIFNIKGNTIGMYAAYTPRMKSFLTVSFRAGYMRHYTSTFSLSENGNSKVFREVEYAFNEFSIEPLAAFKVWRNLNILAGGRYGFVNREYFTIKSQIVTGSYRFDNEETTDIRESDGLTNNRLRNHSLSVGVAYDFELSEGYYISPEVISTFKASDFFSWFKVVSVPMRTGVSFKYVIDK